MRSKKLNQYFFQIPVPASYNFGSVLNSHGWVDLLPCRHDPVTPSFSRVEELSSGSVVRISMSSEVKLGNQFLFLSVEAPASLTDRGQSELISAARHMLRLDEDLAEFYERCEAAGDLWKNIVKSTGLLLRSPSLFEDIVKVICTTNIQWGGTKRMVSELVSAFGKPFAGDANQKTFPAPAAIASVPFDDFRQKVNLGYRAGYVYELARRFVNGEIDPADLQNKDFPTVEIRKRLLSVKGIGSYAAASTLMLLGRYDFIPVDSVFRQFMAEKYFTDRPLNLKEAEAIYDDWGQWKYLAYWFDMLGFESGNEK